MEMRYLDAQNELMFMESKRLGLLKTYRPEHPSIKEVDEEIARLRESWKRPGSTVDAVDCGGLEDLLEEEIDPFDRVQLSHVVSVCRRSRTLSEAGRELFSVSRKKRAVTNDADRLKKYLAKFGLDFERCRQ